MGFRTLVHMLSCDRQKRYEARHDFLTALADRWGLRTYNRNLAWFHDTNFADAWKKFPEATDYIHERKFTLFNIARSLRGVPGDLAECGVFRGGSSFLMLSASEGTGKRFHGFDSFEGLSKPGDLDNVDNGRTFKWGAHDMAVGEDIAGKNLTSFAGHFKLYKGWIPERFDEVKNNKFSLVHIDVDLYEPTLASLEFFYPRMSAGGIIVCDDYGFESCPGARKAMDDFFAARDAFVIHLTTGQGVAVIPANASDNGRE